MRGNYAVGIESVMELGSRYRVCVTELRSRYEFVGGN